MTTPEIVRQSYSELVLGERRKASEADGRCEEMPFADLRASLARFHDEYAVEHHQQSASMSSYPVHRSLPPTRRYVPIVKMYPTSIASNH
jgi:hypothetical protein